MKNIDQLIYTDNEALALAKNIDITDVLPIRSDHHKFQGPIRQAALKMLNKFVCKFGRIHAYLFMQRQKEFNSQVQRLAFAFLTLQSYVKVLEKRLDEAEQKISANAKH